MKVARIYSDIIDILMDYLEIEEETLIKQGCESVVLGYYKRVYGG